MSQPVARVENMTPEDKQRAYRREYHKQYRQRPEVKERLKLQEATRFSESAYLAFCERYAIPETKICAACGVEKPRKMYRFYYRNSDGLLSYCNPCRRHKDAVTKRRRKLHRVYGISPFEYEQMLDAQGGVCAICKNPEATTHSPYGKTSELAVDHDHVTGAVRGLLCSTCNFLLGQAKDDPEILRSAADYLALFRGGK